MKCIIISQAGACWDTSIVQILNDMSVGKVRPPPEPYKSGTLTYREIDYMNGDIGLIERSTDEL